MRKMFKHINASRCLLPFWNSCDITTNVLWVCICIRYRLPSHPLFYYVKQSRSVHDRFRDLCENLCSEHQYVSYLKNIKSSSGCKFLLRKSKNCAGRSKSWKNSKICQKKLLMTWIMTNAKNKKRVATGLELAALRILRFPLKFRNSYNLKKLFSTRGKILKKS